MTSDAVVRSPGVAMTSAGSRSRAGPMGARATILGPYPSPNEAPHLVTAYRSAQWAQAWNDIAVMSRSPPPPKPSTARRFRVSMSSATVRNQNPLVSMRGSAPVAISPSGHHMKASSGSGEWARVRVRGGAVMSPHTLCEKPERCPWKRSRIVAVRTP
jgi:hypothetical protein